MRLLDHADTLIYYDGPQLILAQDQLGTQYVCLLVEESDEADSWLCLPSSDARVSMLLAGELDLRQAFEDPETGELYSVRSESGELFSMRTIPISADEVPESWLPERGLLLRPDEPPQNEVVKEALARQRAVILCRLSPPESRTQPKITVQHLAQAVKLVQRLVMHAYRKALRDLGVVTRTQLSAVDYYELEVFGFAPGSFAVWMQSAYPADLLGYAQVAKALDIIDAVSERVDDPDAAVLKIAEFGGHFATVCKDLFQFISETDTAIEYEWSMPETGTSTHRRISARQAGPVYAAMVQRDELATVLVTLVGRLTKVDEKYRTWRLVSEEDQKEKSGSSEIELAGLTIATQRYEFVCEERLEEERGTGRETTKLYLRRYRLL